MDEQWAQHGTLQSYLLVLPAPSSPFPMHMLPAVTACERGAGVA